MYTMYMLAWGRGAITTDKARPLSADLPKRALAASFCSAPFVH